MTVVAILALDGVVGFEATLPGQVFGTANTVTNTSTYEIRVVSTARSVTTDPAFGSLRLHTPWDLDSLAEADTVLIPGQAECGSTCAAVCAVALVSGPVSDPGSRPSGRSGQLAVQEPPEVASWRGLRSAGPPHGRAIYRRPRQMSVAGTSSRVTTDG